MRYSISLLFILLCTFSNAQSQETIGDVKYSILEPAKFMELNKGWILMDGGASKISDSIYKTSRLFLEYQIPLPDARGLFIRGMNEKRPKETGDAAGDSTVGRYQGDDFKIHNHDVTYNNLQYWYRTSGMGIQANKGPEAREINTLNIQVQNRGGDETRPRNIALYIYIKVN